VLLVLDALPVRHVGPDTTPILAGLAAEGGWAPQGGRAVLTSATYPNHATFVTGCDAVGHGLYANHIVRHGRVVRAWEVGPAVPTLFDACRDRGLRTAAVFGDHHLIGVMGAGAASLHWPTAGVLPSDRPLDGLGYMHDDGTIVDQCAAAADSFDLLVGQLNAPDTWAHLYGPDSPAALGAYRETDERVGLLVEALRPSWEETVFVIVSDHDQETVSADGPVDLRAAATAAELDVTVVLEGNGAVVVGPDPTDGAWLDDVDGVDGVVQLAPDLRFVSAAAGRWFGPAGAHYGLKGMHGGLRTRTQVAIVAGGHPAVNAIAASLESRRPAAEDWAVTLADLLGVTLSSATGRSLLN
jgi:predicted AlkP superfamily pyrophosphatase or phosphodiesterase